MFRIAAQRGLATSGRLFVAPSVRIPSTAAFKSLNQFNQFATASHPSSTIPSISEAIIQDHNELGEYYKNIKNAPDHDAATRWQNQFVWELARHSIGEELVVYPAFEKHLGQKGKEMADTDRAEHNKLKVQLKKFQNLKCTDADFHPTLDALYKDLQKHIKDEEAHDLPMLERALGSNHDVTTSMAKSFERTKMFTPTRSHPSAPDKPPFETVVGLLSAPIDKLGDLFRKFPQH